MWEVENNSDSKTCVVVSIVIQGGVRETDRNRVSQFDLGHTTFVMIGTKGWSLRCVGCDRGML